MLVYPASQVAPHGAIFLYWYKIHITYNHYIKTNIMLFNFNQQHEEIHNAESIISLTQDYRYYRKEMSWKNGVYWLFLCLLLVPLIPLYYSISKARAKRTVEVLKKKTEWNYSWYTNELLNRHFQKPWKEGVKQLLQQ